MKWRGRRKSTNVQDRRGAGGGSFGRRFRLPGGLGGGRSRGRTGGRGLRRGGIGAIGTIVIVLVAMYLGVDPSLFLQGATDVGAPRPGVQSEPRSAQENELAAFVSVILADTEDTWHRLFQQSGERYVEPKLVLFTDAVRSGCGAAQAAMGPFYCPADQSVYIDLSFYRDLKTKLGAPGDFAQAYVIAHEVAHHVQTLWGISEQVHRRRQSANQAESNALSVRMELQADCLAGVWAAHARAQHQFVESGDIEEAMNAASAIGDDRLQKQSAGRVIPDSFTHGSSAQRVRWFTRGLEEGDVSNCDSFGADPL